MDYKTLKDRLNFILDNNDSQADSSFSAARVKDAVNWAYRDEVRHVYLEGNERWFFTTQDFSWPLNQVTFKIPDDIEKKNIIWIQDVTSRDPGEYVIFGPENHTSRLHWKDSRHLQWGTNGPAEAKTLRFGFYPNPLDLSDDGDEPILLPELYHELIAWSAAIFLLDVADRQAPLSWLSRQRDMRIDLWKHVSKGRPGTDSVRVRNTEPDPDDWIIHDA